MDYRDMILKMIRLGIATIDEDNLRRFVKDGHLTQDEAEELLEINEEVG